MRKMRFPFNVLVEKTSKEGATLKRFIDSLDLIRLPVGGGVRWRGFVNAVVDVQVPYNNNNNNSNNNNSLALVRERSIPTERPPLIGEVSSNFCG
jgi:hypothetical protein